MANDNLTLGMGRVLFGKFKPGTQIPDGEMYLGNTTAFGLQADVQTVKHFNSDTKVKKKDRSATISIEWKGSMTTDNVSADNIAMFFFGTKATIAAAAIAAQSETIIGVQQGREYQIGTTPTRPSGARKLSNVVVKVGAVVKVLLADYTVDLNRGRVTILEGGTIAANATIIVEYDILASTRNQVVSGSNPVEGALRFLADNADGENNDYFIPWVRLTPNGDYALKSDDWLKMQFDVEVQEKAGFGALYCDGQPVTV